MAQMVDVALFDLDGVVFDTEEQYSVFWGEVGRKYRPDVQDFEMKIKGQTLTQIFNAWFDCECQLQREIVESLNHFESEMKYDYISGFEEFVMDLRRNGIRTAVVTSSNLPKMQNVYRSHPEMNDYFDKILTSENFTRSKPEPDCYLYGAKVFDVPVSRCVVFEDSFNGLTSGRRAGMVVVGLSTTNPVEAISGYCDACIHDFTELDYKKMCALLLQVR